MRKFLANYSAAAHLALLAVAPLFLFPFCGAATVATVLFWLSLIAALWVVMSPSCRSGEQPHNARARLTLEVLRDPLMWLLLLAVLYSAVRMINGGVALCYDAEAMEWSIKSPGVENLPSCVDGEGVLPFAATVALFVLIVGVRHALGQNASTAFLAASTVFAGISVIVSAIALSYGSVGAMDMVDCSYNAPSFVGTAYGVYLIVGVAALFGCIENGWRIIEPFVALGLVCSAVGLELFSPSATFVVFALAFIVFLIVAFPLSKGVFVGSASFRCALVSLMVIAAVVLVALFCDNYDPFVAKRDALLAMKPFPEGFAATREALSSIALKSWRQSPWLGAGVGSFPLDLRFFASPEDWLLISPRQTAVPSSWWQILVERGILGALLLVVGTAFLAWTYFAAVVKSVGGGKWRPACLVGPIVAAPLVAVSFIDCSLLRPDVLLPTAAALAVSAVVFTRDSRTQDL